MRAKIKFLNDEEIAALFGSLGPREADGLLRSAVHGMAGKVRDTIRKLAPDHPDTKKGDIKRSTRARRRRMRNGVARSTINIQTEKQTGKNRGFPYWLIQEYGNLNRKGVGRNVFVRPALDRHFPEMEDHFREEVGRKFVALMRRRAKAASK